jgi:phosphodiesterase/alkaline phosphatase D-like protein
MRRALILLALAALVPASSALAAGTAPAVSTAAPTNLTSGGATLNGSVNPEGQATVYAFQWGPTSGYGRETPLPPASVGSGTASVAKNATLSGLDPGTMYHYRMIAISAGGVAAGADQSFTTTGTAPAPTPKPIVTSAAATSIAPTSAMLNGTVNPSGHSTDYFFEYGTTVDYGFQTSSTGAGSGSTNEAVTAEVTGLQAGTTYHYRLVAVSAGGTSLGTDEKFTTTPPPTVTTGTATGVGPTGATLNGTVNPNGEATRDYFQFGTTTSYGLQTTPAGAGSGTTTVAVASSLTALRSATTYHYRLVARSSAGTSFGSDKTLKTASSPSSSRLGLFGHTAFVAPQGVGGIFVGCFGQGTCRGSMRLSRSGVTLAQRRLFTITPDNGGIVHFSLSSLGQRLLRERHRLRVEAVVSENGGNTASGVVTLVPFS